MQEDILVELKPFDAVSREWRECGRRMVPVYYVPKEYFEPWLGLAVGHVDDDSHCHAAVRNDLPACVERFVVEHELYHLRDRYTWWGEFGSELRANAAGARVEPLGYVFALLRSAIYFNRYGFYLYRLIGR